jgi:hypothetical protein
MPTLKTRQQSCFEHFYVNDFANHYVCDLIKFISSCLEVVVCYLYKLNSYKSMSQFLCCLN